MSSDALLWDAVLAFDFDKPLSGYGFTTRLASENYWTPDFAKMAIVEYKKFMYLAATSDMMVSPSHIVDLVWHQHLIFTQSYNDFCAVLGKTIQHVPSTHNPEDAQRFKMAKERTKQYYREEFGEQPKEIWEYNDMFESLHLEKSKHKIRSVVLFAIFAFVLLTVPFYLLLRPLYVQIPNPGFMLGYIALIIVSLVALKFWNRSYLDNIVRNFKDYSFIRNLQAYELICLKDGIDAVIHGHVDELIKAGKVYIWGEQLRRETASADAQTTEEFTILQTLEGLNDTNYYHVRSRLKTKPVYAALQETLNAFQKYFMKSTVFGRLFYTNLSVLMFVLMLGCVRLATGLMRDRPVVLISLVLIFHCITITIFLWHLTVSMCSQHIPNFYKREVLPTNQYHDRFDWQYFMFGTAALSAGLAATLTSNASSDSSSGHSDSSSDSSCGSSCSSCGGCGGGGGD